jgi:hypothetical protein
LKLLRGQSVSSGGEDGSSGGIEPMEGSPNRNPDGSHRDKGRPFPPTTLEDALLIPRLFRRIRPGEPLDFAQITKRTGIGNVKERNNLLLSALSFGLVSRVASGFTVTKLGERCVSPGDPARRELALAVAFLSIDLYRGVARFYADAPLPPDVGLAQDLHDFFHLHRDFISPFIVNYRADSLFIGPGAYVVSGEIVRITNPDPHSVAAEGYPTWSFSDQVTDQPERRGSLTRPSVVAKKVPPETPSTELESGLEWVQPPTVERPRCFIAMPFTEHNNQYKAGFFKEVLETLLEPAIKAAGLEPFTARREGSDLIHATIVNDLLDADLVLVDLTEHNPNVLFELGLRMHADLPVVLIRAKGTGSIFDVDSLLRVLEYDPNLWRSTVKTDVESLTKHVQGAWNGRKSRRTYMQILRTYGRESD